MKKNIKLLVLLGLISTVSAQESEDFFLDEVVVESTRNNEVISDVDTNISVIGSQKIEKQQSKNIKEALLYEPGIYFSGSGRFGIEDISIRGISDNRVQLRVDGVPLPESFSFGPFLDSGREYFDIADIDNIEIIKGPSSALYGSSAIGGVVSLSTKDPEQFLDDNKIFGGEVRTTLASDDDSIASGFTLAYQPTDHLLGMISYTHRAFNEKESFFSDNATLGTTRKAANRQDNDSDDFLAKLVLLPNQNHRFELTGKYYNLNSETDVLSNYNTAIRDRRGITTAFRHTQKGEDEKQRYSLSLKHDFITDNMAFDDGFWQIYYQNSKTNQITTESRTPTGVGIQNRFRESDFNSRSWGIDAQFNKELVGNSLSHNLAYGLSYKNEKVDKLRQGFEQDIATQTILDRTIGKNFPDSTIEEYGFFVQDTIGLGEKLELVPSLRYDRYKLDPQADATFLQSSGNVQPREFNEDRFSFRLGGLYHLNDNHTLFANFSQGFRAPAFDDANVGFANLAGGYRVIPNPDLQPERSNSFELGWRTDGQYGHSSLSAFYSKYKGFIDNLGSSQFNPVTRLREFQSINLDEAKIYGVEFSGLLDLHESFNLPEGLSLKASIAYANGEEKGTKDPISQIQPLNGSLGLSYNAPSEKWGADIVARIAKGKSNQDISKNNLRGGIIGTGGYAVYDLFGYYNINKSTKLSFGAHNLFDKEYIEWGDAVSSSGSARDRASGSGRYFSASLNFEF